MIITPSIEKVPLALVGGACRIEERRPGRNPAFLLGLSLNSLNGGAELDVRLLQDLLIHFVVAEILPLVGTALERPGE